MSLRAKLLAPLVLAAALPALSLALSLIHPGGGLPRSFQMGLAFLGLLLLPGAWVYYGRTLLSPCEPWRRPRRVSPRGAAT